MLDRREARRRDPAHNPRRPARLRYVLAFVAIAATLLAASAMLKRETCSCSGPGVPYGTIAIAATIAAAAAFGAYLSISFIRRSD
jgi:polyferredoxin